MSVRRLQKQAGRQTLVAHVILVLSVAGCGDRSTRVTNRTVPTQPAHTTTTSSVGGLGTYVYPTEPEGFVIEALVPAPASDPLMQEVEAYRTRVSGPAAAYVLTQLDNMNGADELKINGVTIVTDEGEQIELTPAWHMVGGWQDLAHDSDTYNAGVALYNELLKGGFALPGARSSQLFATVQLITSVKSVFIGGFLGETSFMERMSKG